MCRRCLRRSARESYQKYAWPGSVRVSAWLAAAVGLIVIALLAGGRRRRARFLWRDSARGDGRYVWDRCGIHLHGARHGIPAFLGTRGGRRSSALIQAARDVLTLKNLSSHGAGCTYPDEHHSEARRRFHHFTFYGFLLCFASTTVAAIYHFSGHIAPHPYSECAGDSGDARRHRTADRPRRTLLR